MRSTPRMMPRSAGALPPEELVELGLHRSGRLPVDAAHECVPLVARVPYHETVADRDRHQRRIAHSLLVPAIEVIVYEWRGAVLRAIRGRRVGAFLTLRPTRVASDTLRLPCRPTFAARHQLRQSAMTLTVHSGLGVGSFRHETTATCAAVARAGARRWLRGRPPVARHAGVHRRGDRLLHRPHRAAWPHRRELSRTAAAGSPRQRRGASDVTRAVVVASRAMPHASLVGLFH